MLSRLVCDDRLVRSFAVAGAIQCFLGFLVCPTVAKPTAQHGATNVKTVGIPFKSIRLFLSALMMTIVCAPLTPPATNAVVNPTIDPALAKRYFEEARSLCEADGGRLWGVSLCGPLLFADPGTRAVAANQSDREGLLKTEGSVFVGSLPPKVNIAYTAVEWAGVKWTMLIWPLPKDEFERGRLYAHESWHRIQQEIGFPATGPSNAHLDSLEGRTWLRLEWRALRRALTQTGRLRRQAISDALTFRHMRRALFTNADADERALELHEGLAEYTGIKLSGHPNESAFAVKLIDRIEANPTFVRSFAYASGPAYGVLLDGTRANWRNGLKPSDDLASLLSRALSLKPGAASKRGAELAAQRYDGAALRAAETERDLLRRKREAEMRARFINGPVLKIPLQQMSMKFDPDQVQPIEGSGTVYPDIRIVDTWGVLTATKGALITSAFDRVLVPAPTDIEARPLTGDGWTIELKEGWVLAADQRRGDYILKKKE